MLSKKSVLMGLALSVVLALALAGGPSARGGEKTGDVLDFRMDVSQLGETCKYWARGPLGEMRLHSGLQTQVSVSEVGTVSLGYACTDRPTCVQTAALIGAWTAESDCFLAGEHYLRLETNNPMAGCVWFAVDGLRGAIATITVDGVRWPFESLSVEDHGVDKICGLQGEQVLEMRLMACPDADGNREIDLFVDLFATIRFIGTSEGDPDWYPRVDYNRDGTVDLFNDIFTVANRFGLTCEAFNY